MDSKNVHSPPPFRNMFHNNAFATDRPGSIPIPSDVDEKFLSVLISCKMLVRLEPDYAHHSIV